MLIDKETSETSVDWKFRQGVKLLHIHLQSGIDQSREVSSTIYVHELLDTHICPSKL